jgi:Transposase DDE domain
MRVLHSHSILPLYVWVDDAVASLPQTRRVGRPSVLRDSEVVTILVFNLMTCQQQTLRQVYDWVRQYHYSDFPSLPNYQNFVAHCHRVLSLLNRLLSSLLKSAASLRFMDATMLPVCKLVRRQWHRVARGYAHTGHNWQGEHYGFKLHASVDNEGRLCAYVFSSANIHDSRAIPHLVDGHTTIAVGDSGYRSIPLHKKIRKTYGTFILTPPHYKQQKQVMAEWQRRLLRRRPKIETVFDYLKQHLHLVSSFPRSVHGYAVHYTRVLLGYQLLMLGW